MTQDAPPPAPFLVGEGAEIRRHAPATLRNRDAIVDVLRGVLPEKGLVLEIASGTGEHVVHFAAAFPGLVFQPSDPDPAGLASIAAWSAEAGLPNVLAPLALDATGAWPLDAADAVLCINMIHIAPWAATLGLMAGSARILPPGAALMLYGPFLRAGAETAHSNLAFDASLKARDPAWGIRALEDVVSAAAEQGLLFDRLVEMPANNLSVIFRKS